MRKTMKATVKKYAIAGWAVTSLAVAVCTADPAPSMLTAISVASFIWSVIVANRNGHLFQKEDEEV